VEKIGSHCDGATNDFKKGFECKDIPECLWHICVRGINDCSYQNSGCAAGEAGTSSNIAGAKNAILNIEECNYGTCAVAALESCVWTSEKKCNTVVGADFYYNKQISEIGINCANNLIIP
jgi:hypothetical protein